MADRTSFFRAVADFAQMRRESQQTTAALQTQAQAALAMGASTNTASATATGGFSRMTASMAANAGAMQQVGRSATRNITLPVTAMAAVTVKSFANFDDAMGQSLAIMGDVSGEMRQRMADAARDIGTSTRIGATQAAEAYFFLASAGLDAEQSLAALPQVASFAQAGMFDMATATDLATDAQSALGLTVDDSQQNLENMTRVTDVLVGANTLANATVEQFSEALTNRAGPAMRQFNIPLEEGVAALAVFADQGIKGREAGRRLGIAIRELTQAASRNAEEFAAQGVAVFDAEGNIRNLADIVADFEGLMGGMSDAQKVATFEMLGLTVQSQDALAALLGNSEGMREYQTELETMGGITQEVADKQLESLAGKFDLVKGKMMESALTVGEELAPVVLTLAQVLAGLLSAFSSLPGPMQQVLLGALAISAAFGPIVRLLGLIARPLNALTIAMTRHRVAASGAAVGQQQLNLGLTATGPAAATAATGMRTFMASLGLVAAAVTGAMFVIQLFNSSKQEQKERIEGVRRALLDEEGALDSNTDAWSDYITATSRFKTRNQIDDLERMGLSVNGLTALLRDGEAGFDSFARQMILSGEVTLEGSTTVAEGIDVLTGRMRNATDTGQLMVTGNLDLAESFRREADAIAVVAEEQLRALALSDELTEAQRRAVSSAIAGAESSGNWAEVLTWVQGQLTDTSVETDELSAALEINQEALENLIETEEVQLEQLGDLIDETAIMEETLRSLTDAQLAAFSADLQYSQSQRDLQDELATTQERLDELMAQGTLTAEQEIELAQITDDLAEASLRQAAAALQVAEDQAAANGETLSATEANQILITELGNVAATLAPGHPLRARLLEYVGELMSIPDKAETAAEVKIDEASWTELQRRLDSLNTPRTQRVYIEYQAGRGQTAILGTGQADGGLLSFAHGGEYHQAIMARARPGTVRVWAEPETGGESYIPWAPSKRRRATAVLGATALKFGYSLAPRVAMADGGVLVSSRGDGYASSSGVVPPISVVVNPSPGMDERQLARRTAREIGYEVLDLT